MNTARLIFPYRGQVEGKEMPQMPKDELKAVVKEAIKEWLNEMFSAFGKWTMTGIMAALFGAILYFIIWANALGK